MAPPSLDDINNPTLKKGKSFRRRRLSVSKGAVDAGAKPYLAADGSPVVDGSGEGMDEHAAAAAAAAASAEAEKKKKTFRMRRLSMGGMAKKVNDDAPPPTEGTAPPPPPDDLADENEVVPLES